MEENTQPGTFVEYYGKNDIVKWNFNCKSIQEKTSELRDLAIKLWSFKDQLKLRMTTLGKNKNDVETFVDSKKYLQYTADIANKSKHAVLTTSRSGRFVDIDEVIMQCNSGSHTSVDPNDPDKIIFMVNDPTSVSYKAYVRDSHSKYVGKAEIILKNAWMDWQKFINKRNLL
ncbi:hypothetical protein [Mucilaginibacter aquatilis]|uniref:Uncharacterized protein n=1 Tax=Mucilaginibacter aquatilis TaxID=1517760 RepID=A0A6I4I8R8_9SPHI|nr:hypothetical protein [Mucilaginibacter aquatilis]MVN91531.1 hypothetical protein [Mucilaginibacter aquatilis]